MYGIIYWAQIEAGKKVVQSDNYIQIVKNKDGSVWVADTLKEADKEAFKLEKKLGFEGARVISLDMVHE